MTATKSDLEKLISDSEEMLKNYVLHKGNKYPMDQWLTIAEYCKRFNIENTQTITNWIRRGIIPKENIVTIEEYNNIRLIKAVPYHE